MARKNREKSPNGVYHVMVRGIDKHDIFLDDNDYRMFLKILKESRPLEKAGEQPGNSFRLYSYCLMPNHVHLLIQEIDEPIDRVMKRICTRYAIFFNTKYSRIGHLFQDRFRSEPCNDINYFLTLVRYIHQNPVKAGICQSAEQHPWNSWNEIRFSAGRSVTVPFADVCDKEALFSIAFFDELDNLVHAPIPDKEECLDIDRIRIRINDQTIKSMIIETGMIEKPSDLIYCEPEVQKKTIIRCLKSGASYYQLTRITGIYKRILDRIVQ